jgi:hypothetical protein
VKYLVLFDKETFEVKRYYKDVGTHKQGSDWVEWVDGENDTHSLYGLNRGFAIISGEEGEFLEDHLYLEDVEDKPEKPTEVEPPFIDNMVALDFVKNIKMREFSKRCEQYIKAGFTASNGHFYEFDEKDQLNFTQQMLLMVSQQDPSQIVEWNTVDAGVVQHTVEEFLGVCMSGEAHKRHYISLYRQVKQDMKAKETWDEVIECEFPEEKIDWIEDNIKEET